MKEQYVMGLDQGTTGTAVLVFDREGDVKARAYSEFPQIYPQAGWVEHDGEAIWETTVKVLRAALDEGGIDGDQIAAIGITNQRETAMMWDRVTGVPVYNAIVWQCRRTADYCRRLKAEGVSGVISDKTGLVIDPYFSGTKIMWLLDNVDGLRGRAAKGDIAFGTIDSWLLWKLTGGKVHKTDMTNASRTLLYNIHDKKWDDELLRIFGTPAQILPEVEKSANVFGYTDPSGPLGASIPIAGMAGDQQAALFGQGCRQEGDVKNTYGTGCFMVLNTGDRIIKSRNGLITTLACDAEGNPCYALEGSVFIAGAVIQWIRDGLGLIKEAAASEAAALQVKDNGGVYFVPAFVGLGAPHWDPEARGAVVGLTQGTNKNHLIRAALESMAYQSRDLLVAMKKDSDLDIDKMNVDGGAVQNDFLMQFQADILQIPVERPALIETTGQGAAFLAGLAVGYWSNSRELEKCRRVDKVFQPEMAEQLQNRFVSGWNDAIERTKSR